MEMQRASQVRASIKRENPLTPGVAAASGAGAQRMRVIASPGLTMARGGIQSQEHRPSQIRPMGRLGGRTVSGSYNAELTVGGFTDLLIESGMRRVWSPPLAITTAGAFAGAVLTITVGALTTVISTSAGNFITAGLRVGDVISPSLMSVAANNGRRLSIVALTNTDITIANPRVPLTAGPNAAWTITRLKKITTDGEPTRYSHTIEQYERDVDQAEIFLGARLTGLALGFRPNAVATASYTFAAMDEATLEPGTSPWFDDPSYTSGPPLVADDSAILFDGSVITRFTSMDLTFSIAAGTTPVIGSTVSPDVFDNDLTLTGTVSAIREDLSRVKRFNDELEFELAVMLTEPGDPPAGCIGIYVPRVKLTSIEAPFLGDEGPKIETMQLSIGERETASGHDATAINIFSSAV